MIWLFALGIIWFSIISPGFRKLVFWAGGIGAVLFIAFAFMLSGGGQHGI
jgi:hypothetical protein